MIRRARKGARGGMLRAMTLAAAATITTVASVVNAVPANATFAGTNGRITFARFNPDIGDTQIWAANPDGSNQVELTAAPSEFSAWAPDGTRIAFDFAEDSSGDRVQIATMKPDGTDVVQLTHGAGFRDQPAYSPDGQRLAFENDGRPGAPDGIFLMDSATGGNLVRVTTNPYGWTDEDPSFSPDGQWLVFQRHRTDEGPGAMSALYVVRIDGTGLRRITTWESQSGQPDWSPDGRLIAFNTFSDNFTSARQVYVIHPDGTGLRQLTLPAGRNASFEPAWSPDGTKILMSHVHFTTDGVQLGLAVMNADGSGLTSIPNTANGGRAAWGTAPIEP